MGDCPMCGLSDKYQEQAEDGVKTKCRGCGSIFFDRSKYYGKK